VSAAFAAHRSLRAQRFLQAAFAAEISFTIALHIDELVSLIGCIAAANLNA
jgi:hypothetical protein